MHSFRWFALFSMIFTTLMISSCGSDVEKPAPLTVETLDGRWELFSALRNGEKTQSLEGTYIEIENGQMTTNFTGEAVQTPVKFENEQLTQNDQVYTITGCTNDTLGITTTLMNFDFRMHFAKSK